MKNYGAFLVIMVALFPCVGCDDDHIVVDHSSEARILAVNVVFDMHAAQYNGAVASAQFDVPQITLSVVDRGAVLLYYRDQGTWTALPFTIGVESDSLPAVDFLFSIGYAYEAGLLEIFVEASSDAEVVWDDLLDIIPSSYVMKAVIIDGFDSVQQREVDLTDYDAVQAYYNLPDSGGKHP